METGEGKKIDVVGVGFRKADLPETHLHVIRNADLLVGGRRLLEWFPEHTGEIFVIDRNISRLIPFLKERSQAERIVVLASGDPMFFGIGAYLVKALGKNTIRVHPNISSISAAFARIGEPWHDIAIVSLHGRNHTETLNEPLREKKTTVILTDPDHSPAWIAGYLIDRQNTRWNMCVIERIGQTDEQVEWYNLSDALGSTFSEPNLVVLKPLENRDGSSKNVYIGMPDEEFQHRKGLITKSEIRSVTIGKLRLQPDHLLWDVGAGSGSVSIEASAIIRSGSIFAVERLPERITDIEANRERFQVSNLSVVSGNAPECLADLPAPDRVFIGGGGKVIDAIIASAAEKLKPEGVIVINTVLIGSLETAVRNLEGFGFTTETVQIQAARSRRMPQGQRMEALNPVWIITARRESEQARGYHSLPPRF